MFKLAELFVDIGGKTQNFDRSIANVQQQTQHTSKLFGHLKAAAAAAFTGISAFAGYAAKQFAEGEQAANRLNILMKANRGHVGMSSDAMNAFISQLVKNSAVGDEAISDMLGNLLMYRSLTGETFKTAAKSALDLAYVFKMDVTSAATMVGKALEDPEEGLTSLDKATGRVMHSQLMLAKEMMQAGEKAKAQQIILDALRKSFGGAAESEINTFGGAMSKMWNAVGDLAEEIGKQFGPTLTNWTNQIRNATQTWIVVVANWKDVVQWMFAAAKLSIITFVENVKYFFTTKLPIYFSYLVDFMSQFLTTMGRNLKTGLTNLSQNIDNFAKAIESFLAGKGFNFEWKGLTDGFEKVAFDLPEVADRAVTETEKKLRAKIRETKIKLAKEWKKEKDGADGKLGFSTDPNANDAISQQTKTRHKKYELPAASFIGIAELSRKLQTADPKLALEQINKDILNENKEQTKTLKEIDKNLGIKESESTEVISE